MYMVNKFSLSLLPHQSELARLQVFRIWRLDFHVGELTFRVETWHVGNTHTHTHTHTHLLNGPLSGIPRWAGTRKVKPIWILLKQERVSGSGISWVICKSAPWQPRQHPNTQFSQARCPSCRPTNSVKAPKASWPWAENARRRFGVPPMSMAATEKTFSALVLGETLPKPTDVRLVQVK